MKIELRHLIFCSAVVVFLLLLFSQLFSLTEEIIYTLLMFNILFIPIITLIKGMLERKIAALLIGNICGFLCNSILYLFTQSIAGHVGEIFNVLYIIFGPTLNTLWVVSFWSVSLTFITSSEKKSGAKFDN